MFRRLWNFAKRHRKKLLLTAACAGGAYYAWRVWLPRVQQQLLEKLLRDSLELAKGEDDEKKKEKDKKANFAHKQQVSDSYVRGALRALQGRHKNLFAVEELYEKVKNAQTKEARLESFLQLQIECVTRVVSALYTLEALLMLHRVEFNIVGRELARAPGDVEAPESKDAHAAFLETTRFLKEEGLQQIADAIRAAAKPCLESSGLGPTVAVNLEQLEKFFTDLVGEAHRELMSSSRVVALFLPESVDLEVAEELRARVKPLVDEARDYLESPPFLETFKSVVQSGVKRLAGAALQGTANPTPLAKLNGLFIEVSQSMLDEGSDYVTCFSEEPLLDEFCQSIYYQDGTPVR